MNDIIEDAYSQHAQASSVREALWQEPNLKFVVEDNVQVCNCCGLALHDYSNAKTKYIKDLTEEEWNYKITTMYVKRHFTIILLALESIDAELCERCQYEMPEENEKEPGPYGGAFRSLDDYCNWKNGSTL